MPQSKPNPPGVPYTDAAGQGNPNLSSATYAWTEKNTYDSLKTKIKSTRNWYPDIDGNDVTKSYTTGF